MPDHPQPAVTVIVGSPRKLSTSRECGRQLAKAMSYPQVEYIELARADSNSLSRGDVQDGTMRKLRATRLLIVASPIYNGSYTGLLKTFLDLLPPEPLAGVVAIPLMVGSTPVHAMAPDVFLKPLLVELGAICPTAGIFLPATDASREPLIAAWLTRWQGVVESLIRAPVRDDNRPA